MPTETKSDTFVILYLKTILLILPRFQLLINREIKGDGAQEVAEDHNQNPNWLIVVVTSDGFNKHPNPKDETSDEQGEYQEPNKDYAA